MRKSEIKRWVEVDMGCEEARSKLKHSKKRKGKTGNETNITTKIVGEGEGRKQQRGKEGVCLGSVNEGRKDHEYGWTMTCGGGEQLS